MQEINVKIINQKISSSNIFISQNLSKKFELSMECRAKIKTSKDENDKSILLNIELNIGSKDEELKIKLVSDTVFELDQLPEISPHGKGNFIEFFRRYIGCYGI